MQKENIFKNIPEKENNEEIFEKLFSGKNFNIERIISDGQTTPEGEWLEEEGEEWVILLEGNSKIEFGNGDSVEMKKGDWILIPPKTIHKVTYTSINPKCIWLAVHIANNK